MAKSKRPQQQPKRTGQNQPGGVARSQAAKNTASAASKPADSAASATQKDTSDSSKVAVISKPATSVTSAASKTGSNGTSAANGVSGTSKLNAIRASAAAAAPKTAANGRGGSGSGVKRLPAKRYARPPWWRRNLGPLITVAAVVILIGGFVGFAIYQNQQAGIGILDPVPSSITKTLTTIPDSSFQTVGKGTTQVLSTTTAAPANTPLLTSNGKPEVIYVGAEYCPYCAADRWGMVIALSRFGSFSGLKLMRSDPNDTDPNTPTLTFRDAKYTSQYITFSATETTDRNQNPLQTPPTDVSTYFTQYNSGGNIPFVSYGNQFISVGSPFDPTIMQNMNWTQVANQLKNPKSDVAQAILSSANYQTAMICKLTDNKPASVCNTSVIQQLEATLPAAS